ncbi:hypothetical protein JYU34_011605 [Plutella xylostella]|uniref:Uncharacterized protein n=1 Tax=Plutella xylostella TaxID=51655 RepID=A0ABQ7QIJ9_PLUXY|nr:hypothetical protein JYU34_011605 [Plutella xylostella]
MRIGQCPRAPLRLTALPAARGWWQVRQSPPVPRRTHALRVTGLAATPPRKAVTFKLSTNDCCTSV